MTHTHRQTDTQTGTHKHALYTVKVQTKERAKVRGTILHPIGVDVISTARRVTRVISQIMGRIFALHFLLS